MLVFRKQWIIATQIKMKCGDNIQCLKSQVKIKIEIRQVFFVIIFQFKNDSSKNFKQSL